MRLYLTAAAAAAAVSSLLLSTNASATPVGAATAIQQSLAETSMIEQVRRVCRRDRAGRRVCWTDRTGPITVCHWVRDRRGNIVRDCY